MNLARELAFQEVQRQSEERKTGDEELAISKQIEEDEQLARELLKQEEHSGEEKGLFVLREGGEYTRGGKKENPLTDERNPDSVGFVFKELKGDLFGDTNSALAHCISEDLVMGKGVAKGFKERFGGVRELKGQNPTTGGVCVLCRGGRYVYYLITKRVYRDKPTYESLRGSLVAMKQHIAKHGVKALSMPRIGCGLDGLKWEKVSDMIKEAFGDTELTVTIYSL